MSIIKYLLNLVGYEKCVACGKWTADWLGWVNGGVAVCDECFDILMEAKELTRNNQ